MSIFKNIKEFKKEVVGNAVLFNEDCLKVMPEIADKSIDMILCDLPYGTTACKWDTIIPFDKLWEQYERIIKDNGAIVLFGSEPFSSLLRTSNLKIYKYDWYWLKNKPQGFLNAKKMPLKNYETISIFYKNTPTYKPQGLIKIDKVVKNTGTKNITSLKENGDKTSANNAIKNVFYKQEFTNYPTQTLEFSNSSGKGNLHPTQKPLELIEYLIKTYTNEGDLVLDNTFGSNTTGLGCKNLNRKYIGIEMEEKYFNIGVERISA
jgi:site-specific DNA-methyltransferase (adenine-specific)